MEAKAVGEDRERWNRIFAAIPPEWYQAPPSEAMRQCRAYFERHACTRVLDVGCGFGRWAAFLARRGADEVVGVDSAGAGVRAAAGWARRVGFNARFVVASAMELPFRGPRFDGVLAAVVLDNLARSNARRAVGAFNAVMQRWARGFFVFNPVMTPSELDAIPEDNPTKGCTHVVYEDQDLAACLPGWSITRLGSTAERMRVVEATFTFPPCSGSP